MAGSPRDDTGDLTENQNPDTASRQQAKHWVSVYSELLSMETSVVESVRAKMRRMSDDAQRITEQTNLPQLQRDVDSFRSRLALWEDRLAELGG